MTPTVTIDSHALVKKDNVLSACCTVTYSIPVLLITAWDCLVLWAVPGWNILQPTIIDNCLQLLKWIPRWLRFWFHLTCSIVSISAENKITFLVLQATWYGVNLKKYWKEKELHIIWLYQWSKWGKFIYNA